MVPGTRPNSSTGLALILLVGLLTAACQSALSVEEAKQVPQAFAEGPATPPPRPVTDIIGLLDQRQLNDSESALRRLAEEPLPGARLEALADFYRERGLAAGRLGRAKQEIDDLTRAHEYFWQTVSPVNFITVLATAVQLGPSFRQSGGRRGSTGLR